MSQHYELGEDGEMRAVYHLKSLGYAICARRWRSGHYELDVIAKTEQELVIVEVKTRSNNWESAEDMIDIRKIKRIVSAANNYIHQYDISLPPRFDIIIITNISGQISLEHIKDAFYAPLN